jgi:two-component sensor histidine kinase
LYQSESLARIDLDEYLRSLIAYLFLSYGANEQAIQAKVSVRNVVLDIDTVIPCALIINELVSNALKHAFPESRPRAAGPGEIRVDLHHGDGQKWQLAVSDNGLGWPAGLDVERAQSLGMKLVRALVRQLHGAIHLSAKNGTEFSITFNAQAPL